MITNHGYLDNPTFRGMRQSLMKTFDEIYILDLHGNSLKRETTPEGGKDENVFDIRQGVAIALFVKNKKQKELAIYHSDLYGLRQEKYDWLDKNEFLKDNYVQIKPQSPYHFFVKRNTEKIKKYLDWKKVNEIFPINSVGIVTARDKLTIKWSEYEMWNTVLNFIKMEPEMARQAYNLGRDVRDWKVVFAQEDLRKTGMDRNKIFQILYRPFDIRFTYYTGRSRGFHCMPRPKVMWHMLEENIGIVARRQQLPDRPCNYFFSENLISDGLIRSDNKGSESLFPLYLYPDKNKKDLFNQRQTKKEPNIPRFIFEKLSKSYDRKPTPEEILYYIYGVFYSNIYRETYAEFLKIDFPRVPFTSDYGLFIEMGKLGKELTALHLLKSSKLDSPIAKYQGSGDNDRIEKVIYKEDEQRIYINREKYFEGVTPEVWNYHIGGYQVLRKYLKDRKDRMMDDAPCYCRIVTALYKIIEIQKQIDKIYPEIEKNLVIF
jgi:predicted helicase